MKYCKDCGKEIKDNCEICPECGCRQRGSLDKIMNPDGGKSKIVALILWFFLGGLGIHRFYVGDKSGGSTMLALTIIGALTSFIFIGFLFLLAATIMWIVDAVHLLCDNNLNGYPIKWD